MPYIVIADAVQEIDRRELDSPVIIGRAPDCSIAIHDAQLSRHHCAIEPFGGGWVLRDLGSKNGTFINNEFVRSQLLREGDVVRIGKTRIIYRTGELQSATELRAAGKLLRPLDPREAMASTVTGFRYFEDDDTPLDPKIVESFPKPQPKPVEPASLSTPQFQTMLLDIASSTWEALDSELPRRLSGTLPSPKIGGFQTISTSNGNTTFRLEPSAPRDTIRKYMLRISVACAIGSTIVALWVVSWHL